MKKPMICLGSILALGGLVVLGAQEAPAARPASTAPRVLTVEDAVRAVLENNPAIKEAQDAVAVFEARVDGSRSRLQPQVRAELGYSRIAPTMEFTIPDFGTFQLYPANNFDLHAGVSQVVYDFNRTRESVNLSRSQTTSAADQSEILRRDLSFQAIQLFYSILYLQDSLKVQEETVKTLDDHLAVARKKFEAGTATELEILNTQVRLVASENQIVDLTSAREKQLLGLRRLMGLEDGVPLELQGGFKYEPAALDADGLVRQALEQRPETRVVQDQIHTANIRIRLAGLADRPSLNLNVLAGWKNGYIPNLNTWKLNYVAAAAVDVPIFDGHRTRAMKAEAEADLRSYQDRGKEVESMVRTEVLQAAADVQAAVRKLESVEVNVQRAQKALDFARSRYEAGTVTNLDLLDTEDAYAQAELLRIQALFQFVLSRLALRRAAGDPAVG